MVLGRLQDFAIHWQLYTLQASLDVYHFDMALSVFTILDFNCSLNYQNFSYAFQMTVTGGHITSVYCHY